jgi:hypothetical protein
MKQSILALLLFGYFAGQAQQPSISIGVKLVNDLTLFDGLAPGFGGVVSWKTGKHGGLESGLYYSSWSRQYFFISQPNYHNVRIAERHLYVPLLYRYESRAINFTSGFYIGYFLNSKSQSANSNFNLVDYDAPNSRFALSAGISRSIYLSESVSLEPEARFHFYFAENDGALGLNLALRKKYSNLLI